jgi:hypothetical protein
MAKISASMAITEDHPGLLRESRQAQSSNVWSDPRNRCIAFLINRI